MKIFIMILAVLFSLSCANIERKDDKYEFKDKKQAQEDVTETAMSILDFILVFINYSR